MREGATLSAGARIGNRVRSILLRVLPPRAWRGVLRFAPVRVVRDRFVGPSDTGHLAEGTVRFECLRFRFLAPYGVWVKARRRGIENRICRLLMTRCREGAIGIDVGANCGFISMVMALSVGSTGRVFSFEPDERFHRILESNIRNNGLAARCTPLRLAVGRGKGPTDVSLDEMVGRLALDRVDVLKIDVDGPDLDVLLGARDLLKRWRPLVVVEMSANQAEIYGFLKDDVGYTTLLGMEGEPVVPGAWPLNLIAGDGDIAIPARGGLT